jgi:class 3 adenylate cyclase
MLDPSLSNELVEIIASGFRTNEINELGRLILPCFDSNTISGVGQHVSLSPRKAARLLVTESGRQRNIKELVKLVVELDGGIILGRQVRIDELETFLSKLTRAGWLYDFKQRKLISAGENLQELPNWGCLKDGKLYDITILSVDIVGNSGLVKRYGIRRMEKLYYKLWAFLRRKLENHEGRIWSWAGDGGIMAFAFSGHVQKAVHCALEIQCTMPVFNLSVSGLVSEPISLRLAMDTGKVKFYADTGRIVSEVINYAAHLEKKCARAGTVAISRPVWAGLPASSQSLFRFTDVFEDRDYFRVPARLDQLPAADEVADGMELRA